MLPIRMGIASQDLKRAAAKTGSDLVDGSLTPLIWGRVWGKLDTCWGVIVVWKLVTVAIWLIFLGIGPELSSDNRGHVELESIEVPPSSKWTSWMSWDGASYQYLALHWYGDSGEIDDRLYHAHYPLLPTFLRAAFALGFSPLATSVVFCQVVGVVALYALYSAWRCHFSAKCSVRALWLFCAYPWSLFLEQVYTEGITVLLLALLLIAVHRDRTLLACACALLLPSARPTGHLVTLSLIVCLLVTKDQRRWLWPAIAGSVGTGLYFGVIGLSTGDAWSGFSAQQFYPAKGSILNVIDLPAVLRGFANVAESHYMHRSPIDRGLFLWFLFEAWLIATRCHEPLVRVFSLAAGFIPALSNLFFSFARFHLLCLVSLPWILTKRPKNEQGCPLEVVAAGLLIKAVLLWRHWTFLWAG